MQPYFLPYIGYFQLINCVDEFVLYDDVQYIKGGWVNRNRILENGKPAFITLPVEKGSLNDSIAMKKLSALNRKRTQRKMLKRLNACYGSAPFFSSTFPVVEAVINFETEKLSDFLENSLRVVCGYMNIATPILRSSFLEHCCKELAGQERVLNICLSRNASVYVNAIGGTDLYSRESFSEKGIRLAFLKSEAGKYRQYSDIHTPGLSILDVLMFNSLEETAEMLLEYSLI